MDKFWKIFFKSLLFVSIAVLFVPVGIITVFAIALLEISKVYSLLVHYYEERK